MSKAINEKLVAWIEEKVKCEYAEDISLVLLYGSFINGTANPKSDIDCYFIPRTERGYELAKTFILAGVGYDIFPMDWERAGNIAELEECLIPLVGDVKIIYSSSAEELKRFQRLQAKMKHNLADRLVSQAAARKRAEAAYKLYRDICKPNPLAEIRKLAGHIIMQLADAVAIYNHDYFHRGLKMQFQDLLKLQKEKDIPLRICEEYLHTIQAKTAEESIRHSYGMLCTVGEYIGVGFSEELARDGGESGETAGIVKDISLLAGLYEEISSTFNKIYVCCETDNYILAYLSAVCLQRELDDAHREYGSERYDILSFYEWDNLQKINLAVKAAEDDLVQFIADRGGVIKRYGTFEEFQRSA